MAKLQRAQKKRYFTLRDVAGHSLLVETVYGRSYLLRMGAPAEEAEEQRAAEWSV